MNKFSTFEEWKEEFEHLYSREPGEWNCDYNERMYQNYLDDLNDLQDLRD